MAGGTANRDAALSNESGHESASNGRRHSVAMRDFRQCHIKSDYFERVAASQPSTLQDLTFFVDYAAEPDPETVIDTVVQTAQEEGVTAARNLDLGRTQAATDTIVQEILIRDDRVPDDEVGPQLPLIMPNETLSPVGNSDWEFCHPSDDRPRLHKVVYICYGVDDAGEYRTGNVKIASFPFSTEEEDTVADLLGM